jgi:tRNA (guanine9-N1)-methyltransferase
MGNVPSLAFAAPFVPRALIAPRAIMQTPALAPPLLTTGFSDVTTTDAGPPMSKNARKRLAREERLMERKRAKKLERKVDVAKRKEERREKRCTELAALTNEDREKLLAERQVTFRAGRDLERSERERVRKAMISDWKHSVCIDLGWSDDMNNKEIKSLVRQISYAYSTLRKAAEAKCTPMHLSVTGMDARMKESLTFQAGGWTEWPVQVSELQLLDVHPRESIVYLTHDSDKVLEELDPEKVYVIGGIVDRNRLKGATLAKANALGVSTARLNLDTSVHIEHGTPVLTVNHCVDILQLASNGASWQDAFVTVLPVRKGLVAKTSDTENHGGSKKRKRSVVSAPALPSDGGGSSLVETKQETAAIIEQI